MNEWAEFDDEGLYWEREDVHWPGRISRWCSRIFVRDYAAGIAELARERGWLIDGVGIREIDGCVYFGVVPIGGKNLPMPPRWLAKMVMPLALKIVPEMRRRVAALNRDYDTDFWPGVIDAWTGHREDELMAAANRLLSVDLIEIADGELADLSIEAMDHAGACMKEHFLLHGAGIHAISILGRELTADHGFTTAQFAALMTGLSDTTTGPAGAQQRIVDAVIDVGGEQKLRSATSLDDIRNIAEPVSDLVGEYLSTWGRRAIRYQVAYPTVGERPDWVIATLRAQLDRVLDAADLEARHAVARAKAEDAVLGALGDDETTRRRIALAQRAAPIREGNETATVALPAAACRFIGLEMGRRLAERSLLAAADHIFDLDVEDAASLLLGGPSAVRRRGELAELAATRHARRISDAPEPPRTFGKKVDPPDVSLFPPRVEETMGALLWLVEKGGAGAEASSDGDARLAEQAAATDAALVGIGVSPGTYEGTVRVIRGEDEFDKLESGDVMVCPVTSPIWSMLFSRVGALVCDAGGPMSHPAIIAREFGIPAVLNCGTATSDLEDGQVVVVDGTTGVITLA